MEKIRIGLLGTGIIIRDYHILTLQNHPQAEVVAAVEIARDHPACFGARLTGAGFAGCVIALVRADREECFRYAVETEYRRRSGRVSVTLVRPSAGAMLWRP